MVNIPEGEKLTYNRWNAIFAPRAISIGDRIRFEKEHSKIVESEELYDHFLSYPGAVQLEVRQMIERYMPPKTVGTVYELKRKLQEKYPDQLNWWEINSSHLWRFNAEVLGMNPSKFAEAVQVFEKDQYRPNRLTPRSRADVMTTMLLSLRALHGDDPLIEAMHRWTEMSYIPYLHAFVEFYENWEEYKDYPVDWSVSILSPDVIPTGNEGNIVSRPRGGR